MNDSGNNRKRLSIPITGLDTATPDILVADGKCEQLHNLRYTGSAWRDVKPLKLKHDIANANGFKILYHHPAASENIYIASREEANGTIALYQVAITNGEIVLLHETIAVCIRQQAHRDPYPQNDRWTTTVYINSHKSVSVDVSMTISRQGSTGAQALTETLIIKAGKTASEILRFDGVVFFNAITSSLAPRGNGYIRYKYIPFLFDLDSNPSPFTFSKIDNGLSANIKISHFGNVLIVDDQNAKKIHYFNHLNEEYQRADRYAPPVIKQSHLLKTMRNLKVGYTYWGRIDSTSSTIPDYFQCHQLYNTATDTVFPNHYEDYWHGEICYFAAYRMKDGTIVSPSALHLSASELNNGASQADRTYPGGGRDNPTCYRALCYIEYRNTHLDLGEDVRYTFDHEVYIRMPGGGKGLPDRDYGRSYVNGTLNLLILPTIRISISEDVNSELIESVVVYATRINNIFDTEKLKQMAESAESRYKAFPSTDKTASFVCTDLKEVFADNKLPTQPFYKVKEIKLAEFSDSIFELQLTYSLLDGIEYNTAYAPTQSLHDTYFQVIKEYNNRAHLADLTTTLFNGYSADMILEQTTATGESSFYTTLIINNVANTTKADTTSEPKLFSKMLSYPDFRAKNMQVFSGGHQILLQPLQEARPLNIAYATHDADDYEETQQETTSRPGVITTRYVYVKYPCFRPKIINTNSPLVNNIAKETNRLQASDTNNIFNLPFANSYKIGTDSNRILAINSGAIEMSDAKFGEFPLYVFTEEGIFAMQSGHGEVLYVATVPINYDRIINSNTLAINHNIIYITAQGLHALYSNQSKLISAALNDHNNHPPLDYFTTAKLCCQPKFNEIIVWNETKKTDGSPKYDYAFVYTLEGGYWSTRSLIGQQLNANEFINGSIYELNEQDTPRDTLLQVRFTSRPIKLGSMEFKRLETLILRLNADLGQTISCTLEASVDQKSWMILRQESLKLNHDIIMRRFPYSLRYFRISVNIEVLGDIEISSIDAEYYTRFVHKLR